MQGDWHEAEATITEDTPAEQFDALIYVDGTSRAVPIDRDGDDG